MISNFSLTTQDAIKNKISFQFICKDNILRDVKIIKEIKDGRILILYNKLFEIIDIKTKKRICRIELKLEKDNGNRYCDNLFNDFIELKNKDLILWSRGKIFYYNKIENNYQLSQVINELTQQRNKKEMCQIGYIDIYNLYNIIELDNNAFLSCNSLGIKLYNYDNKEYRLIKVIPLFLDVRNLIQISDNNYLVIHHYTYYSGGCFPDSYHKFALSLFDFKSNQIIDKIFNQESERDYSGYTNYRFNYFLIGDKFIYQISDFSYILEDNDEDDPRFKMKKNTLSLNFNIYNIKTRKNTMNLKASFFLISHFKDNLIFAQDYESLNVCCFENDTFTSVYKFNFNNSDICLLKNNDLIAFGEKKIWELYKNDNGQNCRYCVCTVYYYDHYEYLSK